MSKSRAAAITKRISTRQVENITVRYELQEERATLHKILDHSDDKVLSLIAAAGEALAMAGEEASSQKDLATRRDLIETKESIILGKDASLATLAANLEYFLIKPEEAQAFVETLTQEAKGNLFDALVEAGAVE